MLFILFGALLAFPKSNQIYHINEGSSPMTSYQSVWEFTSTDQSEGNSIMQDAFGNIYVTGSYYNASKGCWDVLLNKFNNNGSRVWNITWGGLDDDFGQDLDLDDEGNIYLTGSTSSFGNASFDVLVAKYNMDGELQWNITVGNDGWDVGNGIRCNGTSGAYVVGFSTSPATNEDILLLKITADGTATWNHTFVKEGVDVGFDVDVAGDEVFFIEQIIVAKENLVKLNLFWGLIGFIAAIGGFFMFLFNFLDLQMVSLFLVIAGVFTGLLNLYIYRFKPAWFFNNYKKRVQKQTGKEVIFQ